MRKLLGATVAASALLAFGTGGTASAACSAANGPDPYDNSGAVLLPPGGGDNELFVGGTSYLVGGQVDGVGYGEATPGVGTYDGTLSGGVGYGDVEGDATGSPGGTPSGSADGELANPASPGNSLASGSGGLTGTTLTVNGTVAEGTAAETCLP